MVKFCIVIPTFNDLENLKLAINSSLNQNFDDFHISVSDNNSTDGTKEFLSDLKQSDERLDIHLNSETVSKSDNWNRAFSQAKKCDFLVNLHSDDYMYKNCLEDLSKGINQNTVLIHGANFQESPSGNLQHRKLSFPFKSTCSGDEHKALMITNNSVGIVGTAFKQDIFNKIGGFSQKYTFFQDVHLWYQFSHYGECTYIPKKLGVYRQKDGVDPKPFFKEILQWYKDIIASESEALSNLASKTLIYKINNKIKLAQSFSDETILQEVNELNNMYSKPKLFHPIMLHFFLKLKNIHL